MYTITLTSSVALVLSLMGAALCGCTITEGFLTAALVTSFAAFIGMTLGMLITAYGLPMREVEYGGKLMPLRNSKGELAFVCIAGVGNQGYYHLMHRLDDGSMTPKWVPANEPVHLVEDPELKELGFWSKTRLEADNTSELYYWAFGSSDYDRTLRHEFRVPPGTVIHRYQLMEQR